MPGETSEGTRIQNQGSLPAVPGFSRTMNTTPVEVGNWGNSDLSSGMWYDLGYILTDG